MMEIGNMNHGINTYGGVGQNQNSKVECSVDKSNFAIKEGRLKSNIIGIGSLVIAGDDTWHGISASYADDYSEGNPVIKVRVETPHGVEEHHIDVREVDPRNATEIEMFALCSYADANGQGTGSASGSWQVLMYHISNAGHNGYLEMPNSLDKCSTEKKNWVEAARSAVDDYMNGGLYRQAMDGRKLLDIFDSHIEKYFNQEEEPEEEKKELEESTTDTDIVVKPDGSRVLVMTTHVGGMSATVSMKLSEPTKMPDESREIDVTEEEQEHVRSWNKGAGNLAAVYDSGRSGTDSNQSI